MDADDANIKRVKTYFKDNDLIRYHIQILQTKRNRERERITILFKNIHISGYYMFTKNIWQHQHLNFDFYKGKIKKNYI